MWPRPPCSPSRSSPGGRPAPTPHQRRCCAAPPCCRCPRTHCCTPTPAYARPGTGRCPHRRPVSTAEHLATHLESQRHHRHIPASNLSKVEWKSSTTGQRVSASPRNHKEE